MVSVDVRFSEPVVGDRAVGVEVDVAGVARPPFHVIHSLGEGVYLVRDRAEVRREGLGHLAQ